MPFILAEHVQAQTEPLKKGVYLGLSRASVIADMISWNNIGSLTTSGVRYDGAIRPVWVGANETIPEKTTQGKNVSYGVYQMAVHIDIPNPYERDSGVKEKPSTRQAEQAILGAAYEMNNTFINGSQAVDPNQFEGIEQIVTNLGSSQNIGASQLDVRAAANPTADTWFALFDRLLEGHDAVNGHKPDFALINRQAGARIRAGFSRTGYRGDHYDWVKGMPFGDIRNTLRTAATKPMFVFEGVPYYDIGDAVDENGAETAIIGNSYSELSGNNTRIYYIKQGSNDLEGLQYAPMRMQKIADTLHDKDVQRHRLTWMTGLGAWSKDCVAVVRGVRVA